MYALLQSLSAPKDCTYSQLTELLRKHFEPKPLVIVKRHRFYRRSQCSVESVSDYLAEL